jgi:hypothetical protein
VKLVFRVFLVVYKLVYLIAQLCLNCKKLILESSDVQFGPYNLFGFHAIFGLFFVLCCCISSGTSYQYSVVIKKPEFRSMLSYGYAVTILSVYIFLRGSLILLS